jgi:hypothetical protein
MLDTHGDPVGLSRMTSSGKVRNKLELMTSPRFPMTLFFAIPNIYLGVPESF